MEVSDTFIPTAGSVGLLPVVTYFLLVVTMFAFLGSFIFALATQSGTVSKQRIVLTAIIAAVTGLFYYLIQAAYHDMLAELATVSDANDRQTLIRESYNAIGQYRYMDWFITAPLLLIQVVFTLNLRLDDIKRPLINLLVAASLLFFVSYIGHQQLSFDNEIQVGMKLVWGLLVALVYGFILFTLNRLWKQFSERPQPDKRHAFRLMTLTISTCWGIYLIGYFLTVFTIDFNWIHIIFTIADLVSQVGVGIMVYFASLNSSDQS